MKWFHGLEFHNTGYLKNIQYCEIVNDGLLITWTEYIQIYNFNPMGPFRLMDFTGIDLSYYIGMERYQETRDQKDKPSPLIVEKFVKGEWGKKTKKAFILTTEE